MIHSKNYPNYFENIRLYEHDQETFLMWFFKLLYYRNNDDYELAQKMVHLLCGKPKEFESCDILIDGSNELYNPIRQLYKIDIIIRFKAKDNNYILAIEHKVYSNGRNNFDNYYDSLANHYKNYQIYMCLLDPFAIHNFNELDGFKTRVVLVQKEYYDLLNKSANSIIVDYCNAFFGSDNDVISKLSGMLKNKFNLWYENSDIFKCVASKLILINCKKIHIYINIDSWYDGTYHLTSDEPLGTILAVSKLVKSFSKKATKRFKYVEMPKLNTIGDLKALCEKLYEIFK